MKLTLQIHFNQAWHNAALLMLTHESPRWFDFLEDIMSAVGLRSLGTRLKRWGLL